MKYLKVLTLVGFLAASSVFAEEKKSFTQQMRF